ncbi:hypothetical protein D9613_000735 [Agrocybe pediades]|uniref:Autophagy-related protein 2 n=1 Tax=Agrocybe pediades TaxID=84607 RepID=A0A8H4R2V3_9AGAR|nr:hypothetical protein D9613_000735 [Agrocybe pediades]
MKITYQAFGWSIRYFMVLRDNYLGSFTHFQTLSEYLDKRRQNIPVGDPIDLKYRPGKTNMLQAELSLLIRDAKVQMPVSLIGDINAVAAEQSTFKPEDRCVTLSTPEIQLQLRMHDYYMEMSLNIDTILGMVQSFSGKPKDILSIDGLDIVANRLFGPQPRTATYVCLWEISVGKTKASMSTDEAMFFAAAGDSFGLNFTDLVNAPAAEFLPAVDPDVTFYKVQISSVEAKWNIGQAAILVCLEQGVKFDSNDLGAHQYRKVTSLVVPKISISVLLSPFPDHNRWLEAAKVDLDAYLDNYASPVGHRTMTRRQLAFIEAQDRLTGRALKMFNQLRQKTKNNRNSERVSHQKGVYIPQPTLPDPSSSISEFNPTPEPLASHSRPSSRRFSTMPDLSDSENEEGISEADRDARLAKTRTSTPVPRLGDDDVMMSSGDESDDADLTDSDSIDDDWSEFEGAATDQVTLLSFYSPMVKHYSSNWSDGYDSWDGVAFTPKRAGASFLDDTPHNTSDGSTTDPDMNFYIPDAVPKNKDITFTRVKLRNPVRVVLTPLVLLVMKCIQGAIENDTLPPERCIDALLVECLTRIPQKLSSKCQLVDFHLPEITAKLVHHVSGLRDGGPCSGECTESRSTPSNLDIAAIVSVNVRGLFVSGIIGGTTPFFKVGLEEATSSINMSTDKKSFVSDPSDPIAVELKLTSLDFEHHRKSLQTNFGDISFKVGSRGPELITAISFALASAGKDLSREIHAFKTRRISHIRDKLANILDKLATESAIDPLSTIQPSYLVQTGVPHLLRTDITFRFLYHLRNSLWTMSKPDYTALLLSQSQVDLTDFLKNVESRLAMLDQDYDEVSHLTMMDPLLFQPLEGADIPSKSIHSQPLLTTIRLNFSSVNVEVIAPSGQGVNRLNLSDLCLEIYSRQFDLIQFNFTQVSGASQTSLRSKTPKPVLKTVVVLTLGNSSLIVTPHLMQFAQQILRVKTKYGPKMSSSTGALSHNRRESVTDRASNHSSRRRLIEVIGVIHNIRVQAAAENLVLVLSLTDLQTSSSMLLNASGNSIQTMNHGVIFGVVCFQARSPADPVKESDQDILASLAFTEGRVSAISRSGMVSRDDLKLAFTLGGVQILVPRSALRLYQFIGEWRADYLPGMEAMMKDLVSELKEVPRKTPSPVLSSTARRDPSLQIHGQLVRFEVSLQVMHGTWLSWEVNQTVAYFDSSSGQAVRGTYAFGLQITSMLVHVASKPNARDAAPNSRIKLSLPSLSLAGHLNGQLVDSLILMEFIELKIKPSHWDTLLSVQQKFGQDFNDLLALMKRTRQNASRPPEIASTNKDKVRHFKAHMKMRGFRIGLEGLSSVVLLECQDINGGVTNVGGWSWDIGLSDLALSLAARVSGPRSATSHRSHRSAFVTIDFKVKGSSPGKSNKQHFVLAVDKVHAVMQPSSIGELGDFIDNLQVEMLERKEQRALQLAAFKEKAKNILNTFDVNTDVQLESKSWISNLVVAIGIENVGVAFPLTHDEELVLPDRKGKESSPVRAFLFSIKSIVFDTDRGESGKATMEHLSFQFVSKFRQSSSEDFSAEKHQTRNCLYYSRMTAELSTETWREVKTKRITADVSGFELDIDSTIPKYIFSLIDVYREGKDRVERLSTAVPKTPLSSLPPVTPVETTAEKKKANAPTGPIIGDMMFSSGKVRFWNEFASDLARTKILPSDNITQLPNHYALSLGAEIFSLPSVSVLVEYRVMSDLQTSSESMNTESRMLMFNSTVHENLNLLRPTILPFLTELVNHVEARMRKVSTRIPKPPFPLPHSASTSSVKTDAYETEDVQSGLQICFSLRIDQSKLDLTCQPDVNVMAGLHWESGGFVVDIHPGARKVSFFGTVSGLTLGLKHGFLSEDCVKLDARNLTFSLSFSKMGTGPDHAINSISLVMDTEFFGEVHLSRLQDVLCFKAVWLDHIPLFNSRSSTDLVASPGLSGVSSVASEKRGLTTMILLRIREINVEVDLGQSISKINLELHDSIFRTNLTDDLKEVFVYVGDVHVQAQGNLSGQAHVPACVFQTIRRSEGSLWNDNGRGKMLELRLTSGALVVNLVSDYQQLLHYRAEPLQVEIFDDWSYIHESRPLQLSFTVTCTEIVAAVTVSTLPKLQSYMNKFKANLDAQRQGAYRESQTFRATRAPKPDNPLSAVAEAMIQSARSRFREADSGLSYVIQQHMSLRLRLLRLIVFPRTMRDVEIAQFIGRDVQAHLNGILGSDMGPPKRDLRLSFASMTISRYTQVTHPPIESFNITTEERDPSGWFNALLKDATEAIIVGLPSMKMHMISEESVINNTTNLTYDFFSEFVRQDGMKAFEDIYITLNVSLYAWLTVLRKNLTREMEQVRATEDWRTSISSVSSALATGGPRKKKKVPDPLSLKDNTRSSTLPSAGSSTLSPYAPASARHGRMDQLLSPDSAREPSRPPSSLAPSPALPFPSASASEVSEDVLTSQKIPKRAEVVYQPRNRHIERLTMRQLGEATPDVMHPFFMKKAGFNLEDSLPQYVNEYAIVPLEEILEVLLKLYSQQLLAGIDRSVVNAK